MNDTNIIWKDISSSEKANILTRPSQQNADDLSNRVETIIQRVRNKGDIACKELTFEIDKIKLDNIHVSSEEIDEANQLVSASVKQAMQEAIKRIRAFHSSQKPQGITIETSPGIYCETIIRPIQRVGLYIAAGTAPLVSTVLMLAIPANIAGCPVQILCSPPQRKNGQIDPHILVAATLCGIQNIYKLGGAQAIAAMAYGTETVPKVDKIFGPGNPWVTQAKMLVAHNGDGAQYDIPAGPSEVMVIGDEYANADFIAADLLAQAEHGVDSQVIFIGTNAEICNQVRQAMVKQKKSLSRSKILEEALKYSSLIVAASVSEAIDIVNLYAPEHLILHVDQPKQYLVKIESAGSIFLGPWSPESAGDYASGTNHVLPTFGYARSVSGLSVKDFMKIISVQELTKNGLKSIAETIRVLANLEGLDAHRNAVDIRMEEIG